MGVPALFRWLSKKYPKIVARVVEDTPVKVRGEDGDLVEVPIRYEGKNPNGFEVDNLYLDMNGIVHPCTHPEGKPAPETEEDMMVEIFRYTERVVNMARPRKVLMMAIDGVAPRAKMNQQRSRRFRAAQEAADKEEERREAIKLFEAMGHPVSEETRNQKSWDSNAITPGTPFMDLLSKSLKYWVSHKLTTDPGWKDLKVIISDSSVPGEGEHKIMDWVRRQRSYPEWDANTSHVIYGLDADLIMLSLATHEPNFRVLREDVFAQSSKGPVKCKNCGQEGHFAANCKGEKQVADPNVVEKANPVDPKPFIFLDVSCLREYLAVELNVPQVPFPFDLELAIDDWIFMIFFVGNDFLPHLPSLEIREGAIDVLLKIWRNELPIMGGYLTNHGKVNLSRAQVILEGLAKSEDEIFQKRREDEERQESRQKRQRIEDHRRQDEAQARKDQANGKPGTTILNGQEYVAVEPAMTARGGPLHPSLPTRPGFDLVPKAEVVAKQKKLTAAEKYELEAASLKRNMEASQGTNEEIVKNRRAIRLANMSAAQALKAELAGESVGADDKEEDLVTLERHDEDEKEQLEVEEARAVLEQQAEDDGVDEEVVEPAIQTDEDEGEAAVPLEGEQPVEEDQDDDVEEDDEEDEDEEMEDLTTKEGEEGLTRQQRRHRKRQRMRGLKRKAADDGDDEEEQEDDDEDDEGPPNPEADQPVPKKKLKVNADGTVEGYEDEVRLWEPGYRERYYERKFGVLLSDRKFIDEIARCYMEGLCWVLEYYYQGVPAWDWYYPYHYAPFAQDFEDVGKLKIEFEPSEPFKPFAQLLGVFPAASRVHLPAPLQTLMIEDDSPILDFYPSDFEIDMNGKKMAWQGVALLPFIDQTRLLSALRSKESELTDDEKRRNRWGDNVMFVSDSNRLYDAFCGLYTLKPVTKPVAIDVRLSLGTAGSVLADPQCVPNSGYESPLPSVDECPDLLTNNSISVRYYFPRQSHPHRSVILRGYRPLTPALNESDRDWVRRGGGGRDRRSGPSGGHPGAGGPGQGRGYTGPGMSNGYGGGGTNNSRGPASLPSRPNQADISRYNASSYQPHSQPHYGYNPPPISSYNGSGSYGGSGGGYGASRSQPSLNPYASPYQSNQNQNHNHNSYGVPPPNPYGAPSAAYGGYAPPMPAPTLPRNPYAAPPPNPYARGGPPPPRSSGGGYGGYGNSGGGGAGSYGYGSGRRY